MAETIFDHIRAWIDNQKGCATSESLVYLCIIFTLLQKYKNNVPLSVLSRRTLGVHNDHYGDPCLESRITTSLVATLLPCAL